MMGAMEYSAQRWLSGILEDLTDGVMLVREDGTVKLHNPAAQHFIGVSASELTEQSIFALISRADDDNTLLASICEMVSRKQKTVKNVPCFRGEAVQYFRITAMCVQSGGDRHDVLVQITDITDATLMFIANKRLANQVTNLMHSFVEVMVTAIEERSAYNANHTKSMVRYARRYLEWLAAQGKLTQYTAEHMEPFLMSVWLHDIGKLLVPPEILDKPTRLGSALKDVQHRIETGRLMLEIRMLREPERAAEQRTQIGQLEEAEELILSANTAGFLEDAVIEKLRAAASIPCVAADGSVHPLLTAQELESITVQRGTLTAGERKIIESHVTLTRKLLSKVEFRGDYKPVPKWAAGHHELLDGSGYPEHLCGGQIPWETRLLTIIDVYDALTAEDRPYKPPMPPDRAFSVLREMAHSGKLDADILQSFYESGAWSVGSTDCKG